MRISSEQILKKDSSFYRRLSKDKIKQTLIDIIRQETKIPIGEITNDKS